MGGQTFLGKKLMRRLFMRGLMIRSCQGGGSSVGVRSFMNDKCIYYKD